MASNDPTIVIILAEIIVAQAIIIFGIGIFFFIKRKKKAKIIEASVLAFKENSAERKKLLIANFGNLSSDDINTNIQDIVEKEVEFHCHISELFYKNNLANIVALDQAIFDMVAPYAQLTSSISSVDTPVDNTPDQETIAPDVDDAIDELLSDNEENANDPALDLSDESGEPSIAEIPDELLNNDTIAAEDSLPSEKTK